MAEINFSLETVKHPPFENDPPVKFDIPAKTLGLVYAILAGIGLLFLGVFGLIGLVVGGALTAVSVAGGGSPIFFIVSLIRLVISIIGYGMITFGGYKMYQLDHAGRDMVKLGIFVLVVGGLIGVLATLNPFAIILGLIAWAVGTAITFIFYYLVVISRFPDEPPLTGGAAAAPPQI